jgi:mono/diheme cytochrome c family protein
MARGRSNGRRSAGLAWLYPLVLAAAVGAESPPEQTSPGRVLFMTYCASCHGADARGNGPAAAALRTAPADLTRLGQKYGVPLPRERLAEYIDGRKEVAAHGPREMPVWGRRFFEDDDPGSPRLHVEAAKRRTILILIEYLESIQTSRSAGVGPAPLLR